MTCQKKFYSMGRLRMKYCCINIQINTRTGIIFYNNWGAEYYYADR